MSSSKNNSPRRRGSGTSPRPSPRSNSSEADDEGADLDLNIDDIVVSGEIHWNREIAKFIQDGVYRPLARIHNGDGVYSKEKCESIVRCIDTVLAMSIQFAFTPDGKNLVLMRYILAVLMPLNAASKKRIRKLQGALCKLIESQSKLA